MTAPCVPRLRKRTSKVKTGCGQCKRRRIKCGEQRPACLRCARANLICSYEAAATCAELQASQAAATARIVNSWNSRSRPRPQVDVLTLPPLTRHLDADKIVYVERYGLSVAPVLSRIGSTEFWFRTILREISVDDCILHCVIAMGALQYAFDPKPPCGGSSGPPPPAPLPLQQDRAIAERARANVHYERALKSMSLAISLMKVQLQRANEQASRRAILIVSILFIVFELMHGDPESADGVAAKAMAALCGVLPIFCPDRATLEKIGRDVDDEGIEEATWLLPRLSAMRGGTSGLPLDVVSRPFSWESEYCLKGLATTIKCPGQDAPYESFMQAWDRYLTVQMVWTTRIDISTVPDAEKPLLAEQHKTIMGMAADWWHQIRQRLGAELDMTRQLLLRVTFFFSCASRLYLAHALHPLDTTWEDYAADTMYALEVAEQILDQSDHESSLLLFNDKVLPSIPNLLTRCPVRDVRAKGLRIVARTLATMGWESKGSRASPRNLWLEWWWSNIQPESFMRQSVVVASTPSIKRSDSPRSDCDGDGDDGSDVAYYELADQVCMKSPQSRSSSSSSSNSTNSGGDGNAAGTGDSSWGERFILCAIATCTI
ncbi:uncharacterized protein B0I36DRAFT_77257 [Microdochium trichocladiopsis]|uniref:Zn(2)-C6 fungal-type domain-containing protein n=1 Tax=Microdochium trichocladiopsis TaxID=1682393 RepID=A0A9P8YG29_9PEZI|nr:uncharacterized protein B0I36DRAFT_77257 [Microdochium trichocladiopsis]KAH7038237.1 hypothetical protein B0I36DRAFT_77257 [Microdochium trichocladiopsis]